jgi:myo-inositol-hexaphosphate 3-phosphohydrolase
MLGGLKLNTTTCGFVPPKMTTTQKNALSGSVKVAGCIVYDTTSNLLQCWNGSSWNNLW